MSRLNDIENHLHPTEKKWFAIYTKYKCEKYVVSQLQKKGIHAYLPLIHKTKRYTRKIKHYEIPLINCYAFVCVNKEQYVKVLETEYVLKFIKQGPNLISIPDHEIELLKRIVGEVKDIQARQLSWSEGQEVEIISGHLSGLSGKLIQKRNKKEFAVELHNIGYELIIHIDPAFLRPKRRALRLTS